MVVPTRHFASRRLCFCEDGVRSLSGAVPRAQRVRRMWPQTIGASGVSVCVGFPTRRRCRAARIRDAGRRRTGMGGVAQPRTSPMRDGAVRAGVGRRLLRAAPVDASMRRHRWKHGLEWARAVACGAVCRRGACRLYRGGAMRRVSVTRHAMHRARRGRRTKQKSLRTFAHLHLCDAGTARSREIFFQLADRLARAAAVAVDASSMPARNAMPALRCCRKHGNFPAFFACAVFLAMSAAAIGGVGKAAGAACGGRGARAGGKKIARKC